MKLSIRLFGAFRKYDSGGGGLLELEVSQRLTVREVKDLIADELLKRSAGSVDRSTIHSLVGDSALANDKRILSAEETLLESVTLAVLPPVCGG